MIFNFLLFSFPFNDIGVFKSWTAWKTEVFLLIWHRIQIGVKSCQSLEVDETFPRFYRELELGILISFIPRKEARQEVICVEIF